ncbi:MAG: nucleotidyl transferase AbiEii/AbiGii toxin family protein [Candidatus Hadarchaeales archaeon]
MFLGVRCWKRKDLKPERFREVGVSFGLPASIVEREILFYDTLEAICSYSPVPVVLKGGTLISRLYSECPRFSWDIDLSAAIHSKGDYSLQILNRRMEKGKGVQLIKVGGNVLEFGKFERDEEKDVFVDLLSLKREMIAWSLGASLPTYLRKKGLKVGELKDEILGIKKTLEFLPFVDSIRITISLEELVAEAKRERIKSIIQDVVKPTKMARARVYPPEFCLVDKLSRMSKSIDEMGLRDLLCDFYDVGQLLMLDLSGKRILERFRYLYSRRKILGVRVIRDRLEKNLSLIKGNLDLFNKRREFTWCKYSWRDYFSATKKGVENVLEGLSHLA